MSTLFPRVTDRQSKLAARQLTTVAGRQTVESIFFGGITTPMTCTATVNTTSRTVRTINLSRIANTSSTGTLGRQVTKSATAAVAMTAGTGRAVSRTSRATVTMTGTTSRALTVALAAVTGATGSLGRQLSRGTTAGVSTAATAGLTVRTQLAASVVSTAALGRTVTSRIAAMVTTAAALGRALAASRTAIVTITGQAGRLIGRSVTATVTTSGSLVAAGAGAVRDLVVRLGQLTFKWVTRAFHGYGLSTDQPITKWVIGGVGVALNIAAVSTEYVRVPVATSVAGVPVNPASTTNAFAFLSTLAAEPGSGDWHAGSWNASSFATEAQLLVGPSGLALSAGTYYVWLKITDSPEIVIRRIGTLVIS